MTAGCTQGEWHYWGFFYLPDTGPAMTAHFRRCARRLAGGDLGALVRALGYGRSADWQDVRPPAMERLREGSGSFRNGPHAAWTLDFVRCLHRLQADTIIGFCRTVKTASDGALLAGAFYGYFLNTPWRDEGGHLELERVLRSKWVDYLAAPQVYDVHARDIGGTGLDRALVAGVKRGRQDVVQRGRHADPHRPIDEGLLEDARGDRARMPTIRSRWCAATPPARSRRGPGSGGSTSAAATRAASPCTPRSWPRSRACSGLAEWAEGRDLRPVAQLALAYDYESLYHMSHWRSGRDAVSSGVTDQLAREAQYVGAPVELLRWQDVEPRHRLVVVANAFHLTPERRAQIQRRICRGGRTVLWLYAPGCLGGEGTSSDGVSETTGIEVRQLRGAAEPCIRFADGREFRYAAAPVWMEKDADLPAPETLRPAFRVADRMPTPWRRWAGGKTWRWRRRTCPRAAASTAPCRCCRRGCCGNCWRHPAATSGASARAC